MRYLLIALMFAAIGCKKDPICKQNGIAYIVFIEGDTTGTLTLKYSLAPVRNPQTDPHAGDTLTVQSGNVKIYWGYQVPYDSTMLFLEPCEVAFVGMKKI